MNIRKYITIPKYLLMLVIYSKEKKTSMNVKEILNLSYPSILEINKSLKDLGWIDYEAKDGKSIYVVLTEKGKLISQSAERLLNDMGIVLKDEKEEEQNVSDRSEDKIQDGSQTAPTI